MEKDVDFEFALYHLMSPKSQLLFPIALGTCTVTNPASGSVCVLVDADFMTLFHFLCS